MALFFATACKTASGELAEPDDASDAEENIKRGLEAMEGKNFVEAERYFGYVKSKYPFLEAARVAELKLADIEFERDRFAEARDMYESFVKLQPTHPKVDYAAFRAALTHYKEIPSDFFLLPDSSEKDQAEVRATLNAMTDFVRQYPKSVHAQEAQKIAAEMRERLADHELYVAEFYREKEKWPAVIGRLKKVVQEFPQLPPAKLEKAYFELVDAYRAMKDEERAKETLRAVVQKMPGTPAAAKAQEMLNGSGNGTSQP